MAKVMMQQYRDELDSFTSVEYDTNLEQMAGKNIELEFTISSHYTIRIKYYENSIGPSSFFTIQSWGDGGIESNVAMNRKACVALARQTYGAPHTQEFEDLVNRLLISQEELNKL